MPGDVALGDALRGVWLARDERISTGRAMATVVLDRASDVIVLIALLIVGTCAQATLSIKASMPAPE